MKYIHKTNEPRFQSYTESTEESLDSLAGGIETLLTLGIIDKDEARSILKDKGYILDPDADAEAE